MQHHCMKQHYLETVSESTSYFKNQYHDNLVGTFQHSNYYRINHCLDMNWQQKIFERNKVDTVSYLLRSKHDLELGDPG